MTTLEEKQSELDALQAAFDEYIASSRELEEELDAELTKCQNDLTKTQSRNTALANQLSSLSPQLTLLETQISTLTTKLQAETQRRISAENAAEEAENTARRMEAANVSSTEKTAEEKKWREEREELYERLAFKEGEAEDWQRQLEMEREHFREELEEVKGDLTVANEKLSRVNDTGEMNGSAVEETKQSAEVTKEENVASDKDQEYIKTLEEELELVTEQLIEAETKLSRTQADLEEALSAATADNGAEADTKHLEKIVQLEENVEALEKETSSLRDDLKDAKTELKLVLEELTLTNEELKAAEEDQLVNNEKFDIERKEMKDEISLLQTKLEKIASEDRSKDIQSKKWEEALLASEKQTEQLEEQVARLEKALENSKIDYESLQSEMDDLKAAFDDASSRDQVKIMEELLATRSREVNELKEELNNLLEASATLKDNQQQIKAMKPQEVASEQLGEAQFKIKLLEDQLESARMELSDEREKVKHVQSSLQEKMDVVQKELQTAESELKLTQSKLLETEKRARRSSSSKYATNFSLSKSFTKITLTPSTDTDESPSSEFYRSHALTRFISSHKLRSRARSCSPTIIQRLENDAARKNADTATLQKTCDKLEDQNRMSSSMTNRLEKEIKQLQRQLLSSHDKDIKDQRPDTILGSNERDVEEVLKCGSEVIAKEYRSLAKKLSSQKTHNAELLTRILKLQGNIQVGCRIRPMLEDSQKGCREVAQALSETELGCFDERLGAWKSFAFDKVWGPEAKQQDVFQDIEPMALSVVDGYNACIFAYGQTGSGKTFTMEGDKASGQYGISQRTIHKVFSLLEERKVKQSVAQENDSNSTPFEYSIEVGMMEIYNDEVYDLLSQHMIKDSHGTFQRKALDIRRVDENTVEVPGLTKAKATDVNEVLGALERGNLNRATSSTNLNEQSSRSHMILQIEVTSNEGETNHKASLFLVDLAGSERVRKSEVEGKAMKEAQHINKSLSALGNVMEALDQKSSHIPYRDSKLTYLLQNSLGGNSRTMMIVTICPSNLSYDESTFALKFATRVRRINLGTAHKNISAKNLQETIKNLNSQISLLSKSKERSDSQLVTLKKEKERIQEKLEKTSAARTNSKEEMKTLAVLRSSNHDITSRWQKEKAIREEKTLELEKTQEQLRRVSKDLSTVKRDHEMLTKKIEDKENAIFELKKDLRNVKEQLNTEKIRHRRSQVVSRIPAPSKAPKSSTPSTLSSSIPVPSTKTNGSTLSDSPPSDVARIRARVLKFLQENEPQKVNKIDSLMEKYTGREYELLEKMTKRCSKTPDKDESRSSSSTVPSVEDRPLSRQQKALASHRARMQGIKNKR